MTTARLSAPLTLGQIAKAVGLARSSVLHYESLGLLRPRARSAAGYRLYGSAELERLHTIRRLRDAGLPLTDIGELLATSPAPPRGKPARAAELLEQRLMGLCQEVERIHRQQRLLARLLALPDFRGEPWRGSKADWVALLRRAGLDEPAMDRWHAEFERESPEAHAAFLRALGLSRQDVERIRREAQRAGANG